MKVCVSRSAVLALAAVLAAPALPAHAITAQECGTKYQAAKAAGTLAGKSWNEFRKAECADPAEAKPAAQPKVLVKQPPATGPVFPKAVSTSYAKETPGKARLHTCLDQYKANKAANANGGLKWIAKGGGYYSQCTKRLKS